MDNFTFIGENYASNFNLTTDTMKIVVYRYRNKTYLKDTEMELKLTEYEKHLDRCVYLLGYIDIFVRRCIVLDEATVPNWFKLCREWTFSFLKTFSDTTWV